MHGYEIYLERATLVYEIRHLSADRVDRPTASSDKPQLAGGDDPIARVHRSKFRRPSMGSQPDKEPDLLSGKLARDALVLCHKECESVKTGKTVAVS